MGSNINRTICPCCCTTSIQKVLACKDYTVSKEIFDIWECESCSLRFTQDAPNQDAIGPYYKSDTYISHSDTEKGLVNKVYKLARNYTLNWKMKLMKNNLEKGLQAGRLLDIGTGTGAFLHKAAQSGWLVTGLEPDEGARKICLDKYNLQAETPDKLFDLPTEKFDVVTMWHVLEHVHLLHEYMDQIKRVLKKDGVALIALPNYKSLDAQQYKAHWAAYDVPRHLYHFSPMAVDKLTAQHGLKLVDSIPMWLDAFYISMLSEEYKNGHGNLVAAVLKGLQSNINAYKNKATCSSLVYVIRLVN